MTAKFTFKKAVKAQENLRLALDGPAGSGKTFTALRIGSFLSAKAGGRIAVIDSERSSARKYANLFDFDHLTLPDQDPHTYIDAIKAATEAGYSVIVVDSLSHAWEGTLELKDRVQKRSKSNDGFGAWREVTPVHNELVDVMLRAGAHVIVTMRTKTEYLVEKNDDTGKNKVTKVGTKPVQRDGVEYEFDVVGDMDLENNLVVSKTRCPQIRGEVIYQPGEDLAAVLYEWLQDGEPKASAEDLEWIKTTIRSISDADERKATASMANDLFGPANSLTANVIPEFRQWLTERLAMPTGANENEDEDSDEEPSWPEEEPF